MTSTVLRVLSFENCWKNHERTKRRMTKKHWKIIGSKDMETTFHLGTTEILLRAKMGNGDWRSLKICSRVFRSEWKVSQRRTSERNKVVCGEALSSIYSRRKYGGVRDRFFCLDHRHDDGKRRIRSDMEFPKLHNIGQLIGTCSLLCLVYTRVRSTGKVPSNANLRFGFQAEEKPRFFALIALCLRPLGQSCQF